MAKGYSARGGFSGGGSAMRQQQMQQKLLKMQQDMAAAQEAVENASFTASVGGGVVQATVSGKKELTALTVKPEAVDPEDVEMLQDLVISAVNEALRQADEAMNNGALRPALGDIICLLCAVAYAGDLVLTDRAVHDPQVNALQLGILQLGVVGFVMLGLAFLLEKPCLPQTPAVWGAALFLGVFCSGVGFVIQTVQQQYTSASHVGLIFTLEPVFSAIVAYFFAHEVLQLRGYIGAALMMVSLLVMELDWKSLLRRRE